MRLSPWTGYLQLLLVVCQIPLSCSEVWGELPCSSTTAILRSLSPCGPGGSTDAETVLGSVSPWGSHGAGRGGAGGGRNARSRTSSHLDLNQKLLCATFGKLLWVFFLLLGYMLWNTYWKAESKYLHLSARWLTDAKNARHFVLVHLHLRGKWWSKMHYATELKIFFFLFTSLACLYFIWPWKPPAMFFQLKLSSAVSPQQTCSRDVRCWYETCYRPKKIFYQSVVWFQLRALF